MNERLEIEGILFINSQVFGGNMNKDTERRHYLNHPFAARYIRIHPITWHRAIAMRAALLGCPHKGDCGPEFFQVNPVSGCSTYHLLPWASSME